MKVYITKYWQTAGVFQVDAELPANADGMCFYKTDGSRYQQYASGQDWHKTIEAAQARFESQRQKKIKAMQAKLNKLAAMKFEVMVK